MDEVSGSNLGLSSFFNFNSEEQGNSYDGSTRVYDGSVILSTMEAKRQERKRRIRRDRQAKVARGREASSRNRIVRWSEHWKFATATTIEY